MVGETQRVCLAKLQQDPSAKRITCCDAECLKGNSLPLLWTLILNELLKKMEKEFAMLTALADDVLVTVGSKSLTTRTFDE